jgi:hypothetical protein
MNPPTPTSRRGLPQGSGKRWTSTAWAWKRAKKVSGLSSKAVPSWLIGGV